MRPVLKWSMIGCGCLGGGAVALAVGGFVVMVGMEVARTGLTSTPVPKPAVAVVAPATPSVAPTVVPTTAALPTSQPAPTAFPATPTMSRVQIAQATAAAKPTSPPAPTPTPRPSRQAISLDGAFKPRVLRVGEKLVVELTISNKSDRPIEGLRFFSSGPWGKFTVVNVTPNGRLESGLIGWNVYTSMSVPQGQTRTVSIVAYPNEPGNHEFSFIPNQDTTPLTDEKGEGIVIGGQVAVTR